MSGILNNGSRRLLLIHRAVILALKTNMQKVKGRQQRGERVADIVEVDKEIVKRG